MEGGEGERVVAVPQLSPAEGGGGWAPSRIRKRKTWTAEEDAVLAEHVRVHGTGNWDTVPKSTGLARTGQCCRSRWLNTLRPGLKKDGASFSSDEELHLCRLHAALGNKWSRIAAQMAGRSENECMNYWKTYVKRCQHAGVNVYPPEVQDAGGESDLHQLQHQRQKVQTSPLPPPPPPPSMLPLEYLNDPVVAGYPAPVTVFSPHLPVTEEMQLHNGQFLASLSSDPSIDQRSLQPQPFETAEGFNFENFRDLLSRTSINVYPPEEQEAAGGPEVNQQQQDKRHKGQNFPLPPPLPSMLPLVSQMPQPLVAVYPAPVTSPPSQLPVTAEVPLHNDQPSASLLPLPSDPSADQMSLQLQTQTPTFSGFSFEDILDAYRRVEGI